MTPFHSEKKNIRLKKSDADKLRYDVELAFLNNRGEGKLYESDAKNHQKIVKSFQEMMKSKDWIVIYQPTKSEPIEVISPTESFFRDFFYRDVKNKKDPVSHRKWQIDLCALYAYGAPWDEYISNKKKVAKSKGRKNASKTPKLMVSYLTAYSEQAEHVINRIQDVFGYIVDRRDVRDVEYLSVGSLFGYYNSIDEKIIVIKLIGKSTFHNEDYVNDLNGIKKQIPQKFSKNTIVIKLSDICEGEYNVSSATGKLKINDFWNNEICELNKIVQKPIPKDYSKDQKDSTKQAQQEARVASAKCQLIVDDMGSLMNYLFKDCDAVPFNYFINDIKLEEFNSRVLREKQTNK
ncbi:MAG: hypothetical protein KBB37_01820 [Bacteroidia bacterium]|nr:hypothetical protein [Bacteroidia bacterium]MBP7259995.1 hypothetical protein [Bacteroidia bacterium]MBP9179702.1 hypothetical protein [Bacteroidia bacterium]MBP9723899.1 hypothetical protein [Bacteroidia bacterium]